MPQLKVKRSWWTIEELLERYNMKRDLDLRRAVIDGSIRIAAWLDCDLHPAKVESGAITADMGGLVRVNALLWPVLETAVAVSAFEVAFRHVRSFECDAPGVDYWELKSPMALTDWLQVGLVADENVREAESGQRDPERLLDGREERSRDRMLVAMACSLYGWDPAGDRSTGVTQLVRDCQEYGLPVSYNTAKEHLKLAWARATPKLNPDGDKRVTYTPDRTVN